MATSERGAFLVGWISQTVAWLIMVPWVVRVMSHYGGLPYVTGVVIFIAMCAYLGMYGGVFALLFYRIAPSTRFRRWLLLRLGCEKYHHCGSDDVGLVVHCRYVRADRGERCRRERL